MKFLIKVTFPHPGTTHIGVAELEEPFWRHRAVLCGAFRPPRRDIATQFERYARDPAHLEIRTTQLVESCSAFPTCLSPNRHALRR